MDDKKREDKLVREYLWLADTVAVKFWKRIGNFYSLDELKAETRYALTVCALRWPEYCKKRNYDSTRMDYFKVYASRRMEGAIKDRQRDDDPYSRGQRAEINDAQDSNEPPPNLVPKGTVSISDEQWRDVLASESAEESIYTDPAYAYQWVEIAQDAIKAYRELPFKYQVCLAYVMLKEQDDPFPPSVQRLGAGALREVVQAALEAVTDNPPNVTVRLYSSDNVDIDVLQPTLERKGLTQKELTERFVANLREEPGMLVDMARRIKSRKGYSR